MIVEQQIKVTTLLEVLCCYLHFQLKATLSLTLFHQVLSRSSNSSIGQESVRNGDSFPCPTAQHLGDCPHNFSSKRFKGRVCTCSSHSFTAVSSRERNGLPELPHPSSATPSDRRCQSLSSWALVLHTLLETLPPASPPPLQTPIPLCPSFSTSASRVTH